jgi:two-component sensor histidine kinase
MQQNTENELLSFLKNRPEGGLIPYISERAEAGEKQWFGRLQQRVTGIQLAHQIAANHADKMTPVQVAEYVAELNDQIFKKIVIG